MSKRWPFAAVPSTAMHAAVLGLLAVGAGCAHAHETVTAELPGAAILPVEPHPSRFAVLAPTNGAIGYSGAITPEGFEALKASDDPSVRTLLIRSARGSLETGIAMGDWVHARGLDVIVVDYCALACANYVFTAAAHKTVLPGALVAWEGDAHGGTLRRALERANPPSELARLQASEDALFARIGVSECVTRWGDERGLDLGRAYAWRRPVEFFTYSAEDMRRFGVTEVTADAATPIDPRIASMFDITVQKLPAGADAAPACR